MAQTNLKLKLNTKPRDAVNVSADRCAYGLAIAEKLSAAAQAAGDGFALTVADRLFRCASKENIFLGDGMVYENRPFLGHGVLCACGIRICPYCMARRRGKSRKRAFGIYRELKLFVGEKWRLITLTFPSLPGVELHKALKILAAAWNYFRKRDIYTENFGAGFKGIEFKLGNLHRCKEEGRAWNFELDGFHPHIHLLGATRWIDKDDLRLAWTDCVLKAWEDYGIERSIDTAGGLCFTNIKLVDVDVSLDKAIFEVTKYITKVDSWLTVPDSELLAFARACGDGEKDWPRMFEVLGRANGNHGKKHPSRSGNVLGEDLSNNNDQLNKAPVLDNKGLSDAENPFALVGSLSDAEFVKNPRTESAVGAALAVAGAMKLKDLAKTAPRWIWLHELDRRVADVRRRRMANLASRYPDAEFRTLSGVRWHWERYFMVVVN